MISFFHRKDSPCLPNQPRPAPANEAVATKAVLRAADRLGLSNKALGQVIGLSEATVSRMGSGAYTLSPGDKPFELAMLLIRVSRARRDHGRRRGRRRQRGCAARTWRSAPRRCRSSSRCPDWFMSLATWTPAALSRERRRFAAACWRVVESQHRVSTMKLVDTVAEQELSRSSWKKRSRPFRPTAAGSTTCSSRRSATDAPYPNGSRFRRAGFSAGVFYASETAATALAEMAFHRLLFFADSPDTPWPANAGEYTASRLA